MRRASFFRLKKSAAPGINEMTWTDYVKDLEANLADLHSRVHTGACRALRTSIPKADGRQRPIHEAEFSEFSYGFRPAWSAPGVTEVVDERLMA